MFSFSCSAENSGFMNKNEKSYLPQQRVFTTAKFEDSKAEIKLSIRKNYEVPNIPTFPKFFTDYRFYGIEGTPHYRLQQECWTDELGCRRLNNDYVVALGSYYSTNIGDRFEVALDSGNIFTVVLGDGKHDKDCDERNMFTPCISYDNEKCGNLLEFIIDEEILSSEIYQYGSLDCVSHLKGNVVRMTYIGRYDRIDLDTYY